MPEQLNLDPSWRPATNMIFGSLKERFTQAKLAKHFPGGIADTTPVARSTIPYLILASGSEYTVTRTNVSLHQRVTWTLTVAAESLEVAGNLAGLVKSVVAEQPLALNGGQLRNLRPPSLVHYEEAEYKKAQLTYEATVIVPRLTPRPQIQ